MQQHIFVGDHLHHFISCMVDERWRLVDQQSEGLLLVVLDGWDSVMTTGEQLSWIPMESTQSMESPTSVTPSPLANLYV